MLLSCEKQIPQNAYKMANQALIEEIFKITGHKIDQILKEGWTMGILENGDVFAVLFDDNPFKMLEIGIALHKTGRFEIELGTDADFENTGVGRLLLTNKGIKTYESSGEG